MSELFTGAWKQKRHLFGFPGLLTLSHSGRSHETKAHRDEARPARNHSITGSAQADREGALVDDPACVVTGGRRSDCPATRYAPATLPAEDALPTAVITMTDPRDHDGDLADHDADLGDHDGPI